MSSVLSACYKQPQQSLLRWAMWQIMLLQLFSSPVLFVSASPLFISQDEVAGLYAIYSSAGGIDWTWPDGDTGHRALNSLSVTTDTGMSVGAFQVPWNFTTDKEGSFLENPCSPSTGSSWMGVECSNSSASCSAAAAPAIPCHIVSLNLMMFYNLEGPLAWDISKLSGLQYLNLAGNKLHGTLPPSLGALTALTNLFLAYNEFTGTVPSALGSLSELSRLSIRTNSLTGTLPPQLGALWKLSFLDFEQNSLTGPLPSEFGDMTSLDFFDLEYNLLSGPIPSTFGKLTKLRVFDLDSTALSGTIPVEVGDMASLQYLLLYESALTGTMPSSLGARLDVLVQLDMHGNYLSGPIPSSLAHCTKLTYFSLGKNILTGTFPSSFSSLTNMELLSFSQNKLNGHIPLLVGNYTKLRKLFLQGNQFSGEIVAGVFNADLQQKLVHVDLSDNLITGDLPRGLFELVSVKTIALSVNCFWGGFDDRLCAASGAKTLSMDGLGASSGCESTLTMPFTGVKVLNTWEGSSIPNCLWTFKNLTSLHLTGNILSGTIGHIPADSPLLDLSLSHNLLSGTIPNNARYIQSLDLSYNKLTGEFDGSVPYTNESIVKLEINRLSGRLPIELNNADTVMVLHGNLFSCSATLPRDDNVHNHDYICGSSIFDVSVLLWFSVIFVCCVLLTILMLSSSAMCKARFHALAPTTHIRALKQQLYLTFFETFSMRSFLKHPQFQLIAKFTQHLNETGTLFLVLSGLLICISMPLCLMKMFGGTKFSKYTHDYMWVWCLTHLHGAAPAVLIILAWTAVMVICLFWFPKHYEVSKVNTNQYVMTRSSVCIVLSLFVLNAVVVSSANALYIASQHYSVDGTMQIMIKLLMAAFKYTTNVIFTPLLCLSIKDPSRNISLRLRIFIFNNLLLPCVVTFFSSRSCFQDVIEDAEEVSSTYTFELCTLFIYSEGVRSCYEITTTEVNVAPMIPLFYYKYECSSEILTSFIPVYLMVAGMQLLLPFAFLMIFTKFDYNSVPTVLRPLIHGLMWPKYWIAESQEKEKLLASSPLLLLDTVDIVSMDVIFNLSIMLTFGFCSPILALAIGCACFFKIKMWTLFIGRLMSYFTKAKAKLEFIPKDFLPSEEEKEHMEEGEDSEEDGRAALSPEEGPMATNEFKFPYTLSALATTCIPIYDILDKNMVILLRSSAVFLSMLVWDIVADDYGWKNAMWAPASLALSTVACISARKVVDWREASRGGRGDRDEEDDVKNNENGHVELKMLGVGGGEPSSTACNGRNNFSSSANHKSNMDSTENNAPGSPIVINPILRVEGGIC